MAKVKKAFFCRNCGFEAPKWLGRCPSCGEWNTFTEEVIARESGGGPATVANLPKARPQRIADIHESEHRRIDLGNREVNRVLGGGLVPGSLVLLGGEPGIGKSTLSLQIALADNGLKTLYVSGEESAEQIKMRALRLGIGNEGCLIYAETLLENILAQIEEQRPDLVVIDSIQTIYTDIIESSAGSVSQIRECAASLLKYAKATGTSIFIIGHITKDGTIAGPKILEHIVDVVLQFEGDNNLIYRILRGIKNRFGATFEIGVFEMLDAGLREVDNPSEILLSHYETPLSGIAVGASVDGIRPYLIEVQALVSNAAYGTPQRTATGYDNKRMNMLLAVLEKRVGMKMFSKDVFLNFAGGFKVADPGLDLAVTAAVISSYYDRPIGEGICLAGEIGSLSLVTLHPTGRSGQFPGGHVSLARHQRNGGIGDRIDGLIGKRRTQTEELLGIAGIRTADDLLATHRNIGRKNGFGRADHEFAVAHIGSQSGHILILGRSRHPCEKQRKHP